MSTAIDPISAKLMEYSCKWNELYNSVKESPVYYIGKQAKKNWPLPVNSAAITFLDTVPEGVKEQVGRLFKVQKEFKEFVVALHKDSWSYKRICGSIQCSPALDIKIQKWVKIFHPFDFIDIFQIKK